MKAQSVVGAGTHTSTHILSMTTYQDYKAIIVELEKAIPDVAALCSIWNLEQLLYLSAVINEGVRIS